MTPSEAIEEAKCQRCDGEGWVCESHPDKPWREGHDFRGCVCDAGVPCKDCNPSDQYNAPRMPPGFTDWKDVN
jgi:hypothetical protein